MTINFAKGVSVRMRYVEYHSALLSIPNISNALNPAKDGFTMWD